MPKVCVEGEGVYVYFLTTRGTEIEVTEEELKLLKEADKLHERAQDILNQKISALEEKEMEEQNARKD